MARKNKAKKTLLIFLWIATILLAVSTVLIIMFPSVYDRVLKRMITLEEGTIVAGIWEDIPLPIYEKVYFFNITNKEPFLKGKEPMEVSQVGPYAYKSRWVKNNPVWHSNGTVTYREIRTYHFVPEMSNGSLDDEIFTLNGPMIIAASMAKGYPKLVRAALSVLLGVEGEHIIIKRSIRELTYEGYDDFIIKYAPFIKPDIPYKEGKFCWLYGKNATDDGAFTVFTGEGDASKTNMIDNWNGLDRLGFWSGDTCNTMNGTSIETGPPVTADQPSYTFYQSIFCRSLEFNFTEDVSHYGIDAKRFRPTRDLFANKTENPDNYCFEVGGERPSGTYGVSPCQFGAPVFVSWPHFYSADPSYQDKIVGLSPNADDHDSHIDVELVTGISIDLSVRFQFNLEIEDVEGVLQLDKVPKGIFPVLWVDLSLQIDEYFARYLKSHVDDPKVIAYSVLGVLAGLSLLTVLVILVCARTRYAADDDDCLIDAREDIARIYENEANDDSDDNLLDSHLGRPRDQASGNVNSSADDHWASRIIGPK